MTQYIDDYIELLECAEMQDRVSPAEENFIVSLRDKYEKYGAAAFISDAQIAWLEKIVNRE